MSHTIEQTKSNHAAPPESEPAAAVHGHDAFDYADFGEAVLIQSQGLARIRCASSAIQTLVALLMQREQDAESSGRLLLDGQQVQGLLNALAVCTESIEAGVCGDSPHAQVFRAGSEGFRLMQSAATIVRKNPELALPKR